MFGSIMADFSLSLPVPRTALLFQREMFVILYAS
jgi:hypothetical protein